MQLESLIEDDPMTALGNVPCNGCRACCLHNMIPLMPERGDLIWTYKHDVVATAAGPKAVLKCGETGELSRSRRLHHTRPGPGDLSGIRLQGTVSQQDPLRAPYAGQIRRGFERGLLCRAQTDQNARPAAMMDGSIASRDTVLMCFR